MKRVTDRPLKVKRLGVVASSSNPRAAEVLRRLAAGAAELGLALRADSDTAGLLRGALRSRGGLQLSGVDAVLALGGDGTMLRAVRMLDGRDIPIVGVNIGALGFLTSVAEQDIDRALESLALGDFTTTTRSIAECSVRRRGRTLGRSRALNDVVIHNAAAARVIAIEVSIDREAVCSYVCDGLVVATPTGSTGHCLSAGGPIVKPDTSAFIVTPICPHALSSRPLVVPDTCLISMSAPSGAGTPRLSVDGQVRLDLRRGDVVEVTRSSKSVRFVHLPGYSYFSLLRQKLHWRGSSV